MIISQGRIEEKAKELAGLYETLVDNLALARDAARDLERLRVLRLLQEAFADSEKARAVIDRDISKGRTFNPVFIHGRAMNSLRNLLYSVENGEEVFQTEMLPVSFQVEEEEVEEVGVEEVSVEWGEEDDSGPCTGATTDDILPASLDPMAAEELSRPEKNDRLEKRIIGIMQMSGTVRDGGVARWTVDQIKVGLANLHPDLDGKTLLATLMTMTEEHILIPVSLEGEAVFVLSDEYAADPVQVPLDEQILEMLKSAMDHNNEYVGWTQNQLIFAVKRHSAKITTKSVENEIEKMVEAGRIVAFQGKTTRYVAIDEETMERYKEKLVAIKHEPLLEAEEPSEPAEAQEPTESSGDNGKPKNWAEVKKALNLAGLDDITTLVLMHMRQNPKRLWRDYDIEGLFGTHLSKPVMDESNGKPGELRVSLVRLAQMGLVEHIPRDSRPGIREDRWGLTELGRVVDQ